MTPAIFIMGPTGCGKTEAAIQCRKSLPVELISVDSALVYRDLDIGTAKPDPQLLSQYPHKLVDVVQANESYSAGRFRQEAMAHMLEIRDAGKIPLLVGGTMLYFRVLQQGMAQLPTADPKVRAELNAIGQRDGWPALHRRLEAIDPVTAKRIHPNDAQRIQRALEVVQVSGEPLSRLHETQASAGLPFQLIKVCLAPSERSKLHEGLKDRFNSMISKGFLEEVQALYARDDLFAECPSMRCVGYRQLWQYCAGEIDKEQAMADALTATRRLAKRQMTWLRKETELKWFDCHQPQIAQTVLHYVTQQLKALGFACDTLRP